MKREWLISSRKKLNLSQAQVAKMLGISRSFYNQIENGERNPSGKVALRIANFYDLDMAHFFYLENCEMQPFKEVN